SHERRMMSETTILSIATLHDRVEAIFRKAGLNAIQAGAVARVIVAGERDHCKSHGIYRIEGALRTVKAGKVKADAIPEIVTQEASSIVRVNANYGFANPRSEERRVGKEWRIRQARYHCGEKAGPALV